MKKFKKQAFVAYIIMMLGIFISLAPNKELGEISLTLIFITFVYITLLGEYNKIKRGV